MNKSELVDQIAKTAEVTKAEAERTLSALIETVTNALKAGDDVALVGFGTFKISDRAARTGETIQIAAAKVPKFSAGKALKDAVN